MAKKEFVSLEPANCNREVRSPSKPTYPKFVKPRDITCAAAIRPDSIASGTTDGIPIADVSTITLTRGIFAFWACSVKRSSARAMMPSTRDRFGLPVFNNSKKAVSEHSQCPHSWA
jgi:hypothetical protein